MTSATGNREFDDGFSLIELIVAILVAGVVLAATSTILFNSWRTQEEVRSVADGTNHGQIIGSMIERAVRNAQNMTVTANELIVWTSYDGTNLQCQGFRVSSGTLQVATAATNATSAYAEWDPPISVAGAAVYFSRGGDDVVSYSFDITTDGSTVQISGKSQPRSLLKSGSGACW